MELADFGAPATVTNAGAFSKVPAGDWYSATLTAKALSSINKTGLTRLRLHFAKDDNGNQVADFMKFVSGNASKGKPVLVINYTLP